MTVLDLHPVRTPAQPFPPPGWPVHISMHVITVSYGTGFAPTVTEFSLDLSPGRRVALVGGSGAGKSTVAAVLLRAIDPCSGTVLLNGRVLTGYDPADVRAVIGHCAQEPYLFEGTVRSNLLLGQPESFEAELASAAAEAGVLDWIESLPLGWDSPVAERGAGVSRAQRQRLIMARVLLAMPALLGRVAERGTPRELIRSGHIYPLLRQLSAL